MKVAMFIATTVVLSTAAQMCADERTPVRVVAIGDSITQGRQGTEKHPPTFSYRYPLWKMFVDAGIEVDFVGSTKTGFNGDPDWSGYCGKPFDKDHEAHWGWSSWKVRDRLAGWMQTYEPPDFALIMLGGNEADAPDVIQRNVEAHRDMIRIIREKNGRAVIVIGLPFQSWKPFPAMRVAFRKLAEDVSTFESPVLTVDQSIGFVCDPKQKQTHTVDWVHPNLAGDEKLASKFFSAIVGVLLR